MSSFFFFSSRRRHTRYIGDWSSDVCSSDLGNTTIGFVATAVNRDLDTPALNMLGSAAYTGGVDFFHRWGHNTYTLAASLGGSYIRGDTTALNAAQQSSSRYYQRPDAKSFHYDSLRTSLAGTT